MSSIGRANLHAIDNIFDFAEICTLPSSTCARRAFKPTGDYNYITELAIRSLALLVSSFAIPLFLIGKCIQLFQPETIEQRSIPVTIPLARIRSVIDATTQTNEIQDSAETPILSNTLIISPAIIPSPNSQDLIKKDDSNDDKFNIPRFSKDISYKNYLFINSSLFRYLVAGRYYFNLWNWSFKTSYTLMRKFEDELSKNEVNVEKAKIAFNEALEIWSRLKNIEQLIESHDRPTILATFNPSLSDQIAWHIAYEYNYSKENDACEFGFKAFNENPNDPRVTEALSTLRVMLEKAYDPDYRMKLKRQETSRSDAIAVIPAGHN